MKISDLVIGQRVVIQILWGEQKIEFFSDVLDVASAGAFVSPYMHNDSPLELNIDNESKVCCTIYANTRDNNQRRSWKNVELQTIERDGEKVYFIKTSGYNHVSKHDDRRQHERINIHKSGKVYDPDTNKYTEIRINDISDIGISFYVAPSFQPESQQLVITFNDSINDKNFDMKVNCTTVRNQKDKGMVLWGCRITGENKDFLLYGFLTRLAKKNKRLGKLIETEQNEDNEKLSKQEN